MEKEFLENYVKGVLGIPEVDFSGLNMEKSIELTKALSKVMQKYPALKKTICTIGSDDTLKLRTNMLCNCDNRCMMKWLDLPELNDTYIFATICFLNELKRKKEGFVGISYGKPIRTWTLEELKEEIEENIEDGFFTINCRGMEGCLFHEVGHILTKLLNLDTDIRLIKMLKEYLKDEETIEKQISIYAANDFYECVAEIFCEYNMSDNPSECIREIGKYIDKKYKEMENSSIFDINHQFSDHIVRANKQKVFSNKR